MDTLHTVLRAIRGEAKPRRNHLTVIREFLAHLDQAAVHASPKRATKSQKPSAKRGKPRPRHGARK